MRDHGHARNRMTQVSHGPPKTNPLGQALFFGVHEVGRSIDDEYTGTGLLLCKTAFKTTTPATSPRLNRTTFQATHVVIHITVKTIFLPCDRRTAQGYRQIRDCKKKDKADEHEKITPHPALQSPLVSTYRGRIVWGLQSTLNTPSGRLKSLNCSAARSSANAM
jgi:hypothetical protein